MRYVSWFAVGLERVSCLEYDLDKEEGLLWIIQHSHQDQELNRYCRIVLALDYDLSFRERSLPKTSFRNDEEEMVGEEGQDGLAQARTPQLATCLRRFVF